MTNDNGTKRRMGKGIAEFRATLECGDTIWLRLQPITERALFVCPMGKGCGYRLRWVKSWPVANPEAVDWNESYRKEKEDEHTPEEGTPPADS